MAAPADFRRLVLPYVNGAPLPAIDDAILDAAIEFCTRTRLARVTLDPISLGSPGEIELDPPEDGTQITEVLTAWLPDGEVYPATKPELDELYPRGWAGLTAGGTKDVKRFYCRQPGLIRLVPSITVRIQRALTLEVAYAPTRDATTVPDVLLTRRYPEMLRDGALARLHQHAAAYADASRAVTYSTLFEGHCDQNADDSTHGFSHQPLRTGRDDIV